MQFDHRLYIPCLRWKQGEYIAVSKFNDETKKYFIPLIELPENGWDFENKTIAKTLDELVKPFAKRVLNNWGKGLCFIDLPYIDSSMLMHDGIHPVSFIFDELREKDCLAIPTIYLNSNRVYLEEIIKVLEKDKNGVCFRLSIEQAASQNLKKDIDIITQKLNIKLNEIHLVLDIGAPNFVPLDGFIKLLKTIIINIPDLDKWRTFSILGTSFPETIGIIKTGMEILPRYEWQMYKRIVKDFKEAKLRLPTFGDYAISHPKVLPIDFRLVKPAAAIRYTIDNEWCIVKGKNVREFGFEQYRDLCKMLISSKYYSGSSFSFGDEYIENCANGKTKKPGHLPIWRKIGTNHHIQKIITDISNFYVS
jgi:hypothetical protein